MQKQRPQPYPGDKFTFLTATAVIISNMVGTGVFTSLGFQLLEFESGFLLIALWVAGGLAAFCGAMSYAELGAALPRSGGEYNFLSEIYHPAAGFVSGWISATIGFAAPTALAAITFGAYAVSILGEGAPDWSVKALACGLVTILAAIHATNRKNSGGVQVFFTAAKILDAFGANSFDATASEAIFPDSSSTAPQRNSMCVTLPTFTPAIFTGAPLCKPPGLSKPTSTS